MKSSVSCWTQATDTFHLSRWNVSYWKLNPKYPDYWWVKPHWGQVGLRSPVTHSSHLWRSNGWNKHQSVSTWTQWESFHPITFCFLSFVTTQTDASVVLCKSCPHRSSSSGIRNTTIVVTWSLVIQKYLCVLESPERTLLKKNFDRCRETRHRGVKTTQSFDHTHMTALGYNQNYSQ